MANGVPQEDIGVISPYRHQLKKLNSLLQQVYAKVEVSTVDKYQGRDKKCIIMSLTRSNPGQQTGDLLKDWQRLNVAITRAKEKVVFVGSRGTLAGSASFSNLIKILEQNHWVSYELLFFFFSDKQMFLVVVVCRWFLWKRMLISATLFQQKRNNKSACRCRPLRFLLLLLPVLRNLEDRRLEVSMAAQRPQVNCFKRCRGVYKQV